MSLITLADAMEQVRADDTEGNILQTYVDTAINCVAEYLGVKVNELDENSPAPIKSAALLLVGGLYANREGISDKVITISPVIEALLAPYRKYE